MWVRILHAIGMTNLTDDDVRAYYGLKSKQRRGDSIRAIAFGFRSLASREAILVLRTPFAIAGIAILLAVLLPEGLTFSGAPPLIAAEQKTGIDLQALIEGRIEINGNLATDGFVSITPIEPQPGSRIVARIEEGQFTLPDGIQFRPGVFSVIITSPGGSVTHFTREVPNANGALIDLPLARFDARLEIYTEDKVADSE